MRTLLNVMAVLGLVGGASAQESPRAQTGKESAYAPMPPVVAMAKAAGGNGLKLTVEVRVTKQVTYSENVEVVEKVDGKDVKKLVQVTKCRNVHMLQPVDVDLGTAGASVISAEGKPVAPEDALKRLAKQTPVLLSQGGPPDPYFLLTTKPRTLILILPMPKPQPGAVPAPPRGSTFPPAPAKP